VRAAAPLSLVMVVGRAAGVAETHATELAAQEETLVLAATILWLRAVTAAQASPPTSACLSPERAGPRP
jgi:hypothetical protein